MKLLKGSFIIILLFLIVSGCGKASGKKVLLDEDKSLSTTDTGFTGIKRYSSGNQISVEATFKNGVKEGLTKMYYVNGKLAHTSWYRNGMKEDTGKWYYEEGQLFRSTPYRRDTVDGIQLQYFRTGNIKAKIGYSKGSRTCFMQEFDMNGNLLNGYPQLVVNTKDEYTTKGIYRIALELSDQSTSVSYYSGDFGEGVFDTARCFKLKSINGIGILELKRTGTPQADSIEVLAAIRTPYGNNYLVTKKIGLPYKDLN